MKRSQLYYDARTDKFMPNGVPKKIRLYDNGGETADRYTVVFTGRIPGKGTGQCWGRGMSSDPFHPQGIGTWFEYDRMIDCPTYSHIGKKIKFEDAPAQVQKSIVVDYKYIWGLHSPENYS